MPAVPNHGFVVCLYGIFDDGLRSAIEMQGYRQYLDAVAIYIARHTARNKIIVLAGGHTAQDPRSEAASVRPYFEEQLRKAFIKCNKPNSIYQIVLEERSINTPQNIRFGTQQLVQHRAFTVTIIVDRPRRLTARAIANHPRTMPPMKFEWDIVSFRRRDIHPHSTIQYQGLKAFRYFLYPKRIDADLAATPKASHKTKQPPVFK